MSGVRKKRNFKDLHLPNTPLATGAAAPNGLGVGGQGSSSSSATSPAAAGGAQEQSAGTGSTADALHRGSSSSLATHRDSNGNVGNTGGTASKSSRAASHASSSARSSSASGAGSGLRATGSTSMGADYHDALNEKLASFGLGYKLELKNEDLQFLGELGSGNGGTVTKVLHTKSDTIMARKVVLIDAKNEVRKQILRELQILHECNSPHIVSFYGAFLSEPHICMCLEYMDIGSLDAIYKRNGPIRPDVCGQVIATVVHGLTYLYDEHRIIHRDVKPSNILVNSEGRIKICDFGVSGELINSIADTFVGTSTYMSPERILGDQYSVKSDVWSLGISVIELALGRFPFADDEDEDDVSEDLRGTLSPTKPNNSTDIAKKGGDTQKKERSSSNAQNGNGGGLSMFDLLQRIVNEPALSLPRDDGRFSSSLCDFVDMCLIKDYASRPSPKDLEASPTFKALETARIDLLAWVKGLKR